MKGAKQSLAWEHFFQKDLILTGRHVRGWLAAKYNIATSCRDEIHSRMKVGRGLKVKLASAHEQALSADCWTLVSFCWPRVRSHQKAYECIPFASSKTRGGAMSRVLRRRCWLPGCTPCQEGSRCPGELPDYSQLLKTQQILTDSHINIYGTTEKPFIKSLSFSLADLCADWAHFCTVSFQFSVINPN